MTENEKKYGKRENDRISKLFAISFECGAAFCLGNVQKYADRYVSDSEKANNPEDIEKIKDYFNRYLEHSEYDFYNEINFAQSIQCLTEHKDNSKIIGFIYYLFGKMF